MYSFARTTSAIQKISDVSRRWKVGLKDLASEPRRVAIRLSKAELSTIQPKPSPRCETKFEVIAVGAEGRSTSLGNKSPDLIDEAAILGTKSLVARLHDIYPFFDAP